MRRHVQKSARAATLRELRWMKEQLGLEVGTWREGARVWDGRRRHKSDESLCEWTPADSGFSCGYEHADHVFSRERRLDEYVENTVDGWTKLIGRLQLLVRHAEALAAIARTRRRAVEEGLRADAQHD